MKTTRPALQWTERYLELLGVERAPPGIEALTALVRAHVLRIPFENVTALLRSANYRTGAVPEPDPAVLLSTWEARSGGGVCFEIAAMFTRLLTALGYSAHRVLGQISLPFGHQAILVHLEGRRYLVDVGNGAPIFQPIALDTEPVDIHQHGLSYRFRNATLPDELLQERLIDGTWTIHCRYSLAPPRPEDCNRGYQHHHTPNASWVTSTLTMVRSTAEAVFALRDGDLTHYTNADKYTESITNRAVLCKLPTDIFALPALPIEEALTIRERYAGRPGGASIAR